MNHVVLVGRLTKDPDLRYIPGEGTPVVNFTLAINRGYKKEGKSSVTIAIGCTGGQHRSVALTERVGAELKEEDYHVNITHRDRLKRKETVNRS